MAGFDCIDHHHHGSRTCWAHNDIDHYESTLDDICNMSAMYAFLWACLIMVSLQHSYSPHSKNLSTLSQAVSNNPMEFTYPGYWIKACDLTSCDKWLPWCYGRWFLVACQLMENFPPENLPLKNLPKQAGVWNSNPPSLRVGDWYLLCWCDLLCCHPWTLWLLSPH